MIARKTWQDVKLMTIGYTLLLEILLIPAVLLYPELRNHHETIARMIPMKMLRDMFESMGDLEAGYLNYMAAQMFFKGTNFVGLAGAILLTTGMIARERENRTLEFLLARPLGRTKILLSKFFVIATSLVVPIFVTSWSALPLSKIIGESLDFWHLTIASIHASAFVLLFASLTCLCSVLGRTQAQTAFWVGGFTVLQAAIYLIQEIRVASVFQLSDWSTYGPVMVGNLPLSHLFFQSTVWILLASAVLVGIAVAAFRRITP